MTESNPAARAAAAGWYPVEGTAQLRWWDGTQWTEYTKETAATHPYVPAAQLKAPDGTKTNTVWAFIVGLLPLLTLALLPAYVSSVAASMANISRNPADAAQLQSSALFSPAYFAFVGVSFLTYALSVVFGYLDWRELKARGVPLPFHWAWGFLEAPLVYIIGRTVVVRRRARGSFAPLWVMIIATVVIFVGSLVVSLTALAPVFGEIARTTSR
jgi:hypothetical protein